MASMSAKFGEEIHKGLDSIVFTSLFPNMSIVTFTFDPKINRVHPLFIAYKSVKFDQEAHNHLVAIVFTSLIPYMSNVALTFDL